jgi:hypothetical protein
LFAFRFTAVTLKLLSLQSTDLDRVMNRTPHIFSPKQIKEIKSVTAKQKSQNASFKKSLQNAYGHDCGGGDDGGDADHH